MSGYQPEEGFSMWLAIFQATIIKIQQATNVEHEDA